MRRNENKRASQNSGHEMESQVDVGYDGYYDDVLPPDSDRMREGIDLRLVKRIIVLLVVVFLVITACVAILFFI